MFNKLFFPLKEGFWLFSEAGRDSYRYTILRAMITGFKLFRKQEEPRSPISADDSGSRKGHGYGMFCLFPDTDRGPTAAPPRERSGHAEEGTQAAAPKGSSFATGRDDASPTLTGGRGGLGGSLRVWEGRSRGGARERPQFRR